MTDTPDPVRLVSELDDLLTRRRGVRLELADATRRLASANVADAVRAARELLAGRVADLQSAVGDITAVLRELRTVEQLIRFTEAGWPDRRRELARQFDSRPQVGLAGWLDDWFTAIAHCRFEAAARLTAMPELPESVRVIVRRCRAAGRALQVRGWPVEPGDSTWAVAAPLLLAGAGGLRVDDRTVPGEQTRADLWLLLVRLAFATDRLPEAELLLAVGQRDRRLDSAVHEALTERLEMARSTAVRAGDPTGTGMGSAVALLELVRVADHSEPVGPADLDVGAGMVLARSAVAAAASVEGAEREVARMLDPIPVEIDLALAERGIEEGNHALGRRWLEVLLSTASGLYLAEGHRRLADLAETGGDTAAEQQHRLAAATQWQACGLPDQGLIEMERLVALDPLDAEAHCRLGSVLLQLADSNDPEVVVGRLQAAIEQTSEVPGMLAAAPDGWLSAWALFVQSYAHAQLSDYLVGSGGHDWLALHAALRSVGFQPDEFSYWLCLADAAYGMDLWSLAEVASRRAVELNPTQDARSQHSRALINLGEYSDALEAIGEPDSQFEWSMKAHAHLHQGAPQTTVQIHESHPPAEHEDWAWLSHIAALLLLDRPAEASALAQPVIERLRRRGSAAALADAGLMSALIGDFERARDDLLDSGLADEPERQLTIALVAAGTGDRLDAERRLLTYVRSFTSLDDFGAWEHVSRPLLHTILRRAGARPPDLVEVDEAVRALRSRLTGRREPLDELAAAAERKPPPTAATGITDLVRATVALARDDLAAVASAVAGLAGDPVAASLVTWLEKPLPQPEEPVGPAAEPALTPEPPVGLELSRDWFVGFDKPVQDHPLFAAVMPAARLGAPPAGSPLPPVSVSAVDDLDLPDYRVRLPDGRQAAGRLACTRAWPPGVEALLSPSPGKESAAQPEIVAPAPPAPDQACELPPVPDLAELLTQSPLEAIVEQVERLVAPEADVSPRPAPVLG